MRVRTRGTKRRCGFGRGAKMGGLGELGSYAHPSDVIHESFYAVESEQFVVEREIAPYSHPERGRKKLVNKYVVSKFASGPLQWRSLHLTAKARPRPGVPAGAATRPPRGKTPTDAAVRCRSPLSTHLHPDTREMVYPSHVLSAARVRSVLTLLGLRASSPAGATTRAHATAGESPASPSPVLLSPAERLSERDAGSRDDNDGRARVRGSLIRQSAVEQETSAKAEMKLLCESDGERGSGGKRGGGNVEEAGKEVETLQRKRKSERVIQRIEAENKNERRQQVLVPAAGCHTTGTAAGVKTGWTCTHRRFRVDIACNEHCAPHSREQGRPTAPPRMTTRTSLTAHKSAAYAAYGETRLPRPHDDRGKQRHRITGYALAASVGRPVPHLGYSPAPPYSLLTTLASSAMDTKEEAHGKCGASRRALARDMGWGVGARGGETPGQSGGGTIEGNESATEGGGRNGKQARLVVDDGVQVFPDHFRFGRCLEFRVEVSSSPILLYPLILGRDRDRPVFRVGVVRLPKHIARRERNKGAMAVPGDRKLTPFWVAAGLQTGIDTFTYGCANVDHSTKNGTNEKRKRKSAKLGRINRHIGNSAEVQCSAIPGTSLLYITHTPYIRWAH
ncbi:hypothetical protein B0H13DRAFT_2531628 [Mycena leptocephala]|nr:hypothetical protein B0H13DRAFT_2531628 [Mycena leptocephala]